jgi:hypothetical protein
MCAVRATSTVAPQFRHRRNHELKVTQQSLLNLAVAMLIWHQLIPVVLAWSQIFLHGWSDRGFRLQPSYALMAH